MIAGSGNMNFFVPFLARVCKAIYRASISKYESETNNLINNLIRMKHNAHFIFIDKMCVILKPTGC